LNERDVQFTFEMFDVLHMICTFMGRFFRYFLRYPGVFTCRFLSFKGYTQVFLRVTFFRSRSIHNVFFAFRPFLVGYVLVHTLVDTDTDHVLSRVE